MNPVKVQINKLTGGGYVIYVWDTGKEPGEVHRIGDKDELIEFLRGLYS